MRLAERICTALSAFSRHLAGIVTSPPACAVTVPSAGHGHGSADVGLEEENGGASWRNATSIGRDGNEVDVLMNKVVEIVCDAVCSIGSKRDRKATKRGNRGMSLECLDTRVLPISKIFVITRFVIVILRVLRRVLCAESVCCGESELDAV